MDYWYTVLKESINFNELPIEFALINVKVDSTIPDISEFENKRVIIVSYN